MRAPARRTERAEWLGLAAGPPAAAETLLAADLAGLFQTAKPLRVLPLLGDAGAGNIALLLNEPHVDIAFVSTDALAEAEAARKDLSRHLELVARLYPQEVHVLARADIRNLADLAGKKVNFGPRGRKLGRHGVGSVQGARPRGRAAEPRCRHCH